MSGPEHSQDKKGLDAIPDPEETADAMTELRQLRALHRETTFRETPNLWDLISTTREPYSVDIKYRFDRNSEQQDGQADSHLSESEKVKLHDQLFAELRDVIDCFPLARTTIFDDKGKIIDPYLFDAFMSFSHTAEGRVLANAFTQSVTLGTSLLFKDSLKDPGFMTALYDIVNLVARRERDQRKGGDKTHQDDFEQAFSKPGFMSELCDPSNVRKDQVNCLIGLIKSSSTTKEDIRREKKRLAPFVAEEKKRIANARDARSNNTFSVSVADLITSHWLPLLLWKQSIKKIVALLDNLKNKGVFGVGTVSNIDYAAVRTALTRLGLRE